MAQEDPKKMNLPNVRREVGLVHEVEANVVDTPEYRSG